jgi:hypothetical protein
VDRAVHLHGESEFSAVEIDDERAEPMLSAKLVASAVSVAQALPEFAFGVSGILPEIPSVASRLGRIVEAGCVV